MSVTVDIAAVERFDIDWLSREVVRRLPSPVVGISAAPRTADGIEERHRDITAEQAIELAGAFQKAGANRLRQIEAASTP